jgi:hypothetical protein
MTTKELAKKNYDRGLWSREMLKALVAKTALSFTAADFEEITGEAYAA